MYNGFKSKSTVFNELYLFYHFVCKNLLFYFKTGFTWSVFLRYDLIINIGIMVVTVYVD